jgi:hypothetical protein
MNTYIVESSLKYIKNNYKLIVKISRWIYFELIKINYSNSKIDRAAAI